MGFTLNKWTNLTVFEALYGLMVGKNHVEIS